MPPTHTISVPVKPRTLMRDPVYQQLNDLLRELIRHGEFKAGQQFLTEREVAERFSVSRVTANKALSHLVVSGVLEFRKGVGTFVREGVLDYNLQSLMSFTRKATLAGKRPETRVLRFQSMKGREVNEFIRRTLRLADTDPVYYCERLRLADKEPVILERRHLAGRFCPGLTKADLKGSLYVLLTQKYGLPVNAAEQQIRAVSLSEVDARLLRVPAGSPALRVHAVGYAEEPLWLEDTLYRADRYEFHNALGASRNTQPASLVICAPPWASEQHP
jgi:GntR family transcriptional regulator